MRIINIRSKMDGLKSDYYSSLGNSLKDMSQQYKHESEINTLTREKDSYKTVLTWIQWQYEDLSAEQIESLGTREYAIYKTVVSVLSRY